MSRYELLLFLHIASAITWLGAGLYVQFIASRAQRARDFDNLARIAREVGAASNAYFIPASLATLLFGILTTIDGPWSFGDLWILIGLAGWAATFATGTFFLGPSGKRIAELLQSDRAAAVNEIRRVLLISRIDLVVLYTVVADMVLKPTTDDVGTLIVFAAVVAVGVAFVVMQLRRAPAALETA